MIVNGTELNIQQRPRSTKLAVDASSNHAGVAQTGSLSG